MSSQKRQKPEDRREWEDEIPPRKVWAAARRFINKPLRKFWKKEIRK